MHVCVQPIAGAEASWEIVYPGNVIQFLYLIYHTYTQDPVWHCPDFLKTLAMVAFHSEPPKVCGCEAAQTLQKCVAMKNKFQRRL